MKKDLSQVLSHPRITEKATRTSESSVYVFNIDPKTTKTLVAQAFIQKYKTTPVKIRTVTIPAKRVFVRGKVGHKSGYKKAYIYLKNGEKVEII
jgi:large subunit ribosomal protein L23